MHGDVQSGEFDGDGLDLLAFRYVAGEMSSDEAAAFEQRLSDDLAACEAVARAVDLAQAVAAAPRKPDATIRLVGASRRVRFARWVAAAAAALVVSSLVYQWSQNPSELRTLTKFWARQIGQESVDLSGSNLLAGSEELMAIEEENDVTVPVWMIEAVVGEMAREDWEDS